MNGDDILSLQTQLCQVVSKHTGMGCHPSGQTKEIVVAPVKTIFTLTELVILFLLLNDSNIIGLFL